MERSGGPRPAASAQVEIRGRLAAIFLTPTKGPSSKNAAASAAHTVYSHEIKIGHGLYVVRYALSGGPTEVGACKRSVLAAGGRHGVTQRSRVKTRLAGHCRPSRRVFSVVVLQACPLLV